MSYTDFECYKYRIVIKILYGMVIFLLFIYMSFFNIYFKGKGKFQGKRVHRRIAILEDSTCIADSECDYIEYYDEDEEEPAIVTEGVVSATIRAESPPIFGGGIPTGRYPDVPGVHVCAEVAPSTTAPETARPVPLVVAFSATRVERLPRQRLRRVLPPADLVLQPPPRHPRI